MRFRNIVRRCQNGVKRLRLPATTRGVVRSNFVSNDINRVKGHRAKRLFTYNCNKLKREFDNKHSIDEENSDEYLINQALQSHKTFEEEKQKLTEAFYNNMAKHNDCPDEHFYAQKYKQLTNQIEKLAEQDTKVQKQASQRQNKRLAFLKDPHNKICYVCGAKGHVSKDCTSDKKLLKRKQRTMLYKKHLVEKKVYKLDIDAEYKRLQDRIKQLQDENCKLKQLIGNDKSHFEVGSVSSEINGGKVACDPSQDDKILQSSPECTESASMDDVDMSCPFEAPTKTIYDMTYEELQVHFAQKGERRRSMQAQCCTIIRTLVLVTLVMLLVAMVLLLGQGAKGVMDSVVNSHTTQDDHLNLTTSIALFENNGWKSHISSPNYSQLLFVILCMAGILCVFCSSVITKADNMIRWNAMSNYRQQLRDSGCTFRLPYKVSQLGSDEYYYTSRAAYNLVYSHLVQSMTLIEIIVCLFSASMKVLSDIIGKIIFRYHFLRHILKAIFRCARFAFRIVWAVIIIIAQVIRAIWQFILIMILIAAVLFAGKYTIKWSMESYTYIRYYSINWVCQLENQTRAMFASLFGSMTLNSIGIVKLTTSVPTLASKKTYILGLISRFLGAFRQG